MQEDIHCGVKQNAMTLLNYSTAYPFRHKHRTINCSFCCSSFDDPVMFRSHMDATHLCMNLASLLPVRLFENSCIRVDITNLRCKHCDKGFSTLETVAKHLNDEHNVGINLNLEFGLVPLKLQKDRFDCLMCAKKFPTLNRLDKHAGTHFARYICEVCGQGFEDSKILDAHNKTHKIGTSLALKGQEKSESDPKIICSVCKKTFPSKEARIEHRRNEKSCLPIKCQLCEERFMVWDRKEQHMADVHGKPKKLNRCFECNKEFRTRLILYSHYKEAHTEDFKCEYCGKTFPSQPKLRDHICREHTGERPFICSQCGKAFINAAALREHVITHDDSKKLACPSCKRLFVMKYKLKAHVLQHHPDIFKELFPGPNRMRLTK